MRTIENILEFLEEVVLPLFVVWCSWRILDFEWMVFTGITQILIKIYNKNRRF